MEISGDYDNKTLAIVFFSLPLLGSWHRCIDELLMIQKTCQEVNIWLQNGDPVDLVRLAIDTLITEYPILKRHLGAKADIVHGKQFAIKNDARTGEDADENMSCGTWTRFYLRRRRGDQLISSSIMSQPCLTLDCLFTRATVY